MLRAKYNKFFPIPHFLSQPSFGLDISDQSIKFVEFLETHKGLRIGRFGERPIPVGVIESGKIIESKHLKEILLLLKKEYGIKSVRVSLPEEQVYLFKLKIIKESTVDIRQTIEFSLEEHVPIPPTDLVFDYEIFKEDEKNIEVEVTTAPKQIIESYLSIFRDCGLNVSSFELEAQALARAVILDKDLDTYMIVDLGKQRTGISVVSNNIVIFTSTVDAGGVMLTNLIEKNFKISFLDAENMKVKYGLSRSSGNQEVFSVLLNGVSIIRDEISKHFLYWHTHKDEDGEVRPKIKKIILCGGDSNLIGFAEYLSISMKQNVEIANVWRNVISPDEYIPEMSFQDSLSYATAIGLALRDLYYD
ncbi:MAG: pilus assembly protein PilM [Candidatus Nomurabacteria bacterium]|nr:pilus assembly protein PilM [Candidatus Nomurabacteria bacterium]